MKIGILTFHYAHNYGAMLQAYALVAVLKTWGHDVKIIDYRVPSIEYVYQKRSFPKLVGFFMSQHNAFPIAFLKAIKYYPNERRKKSLKWERFEAFSRRYLPKTHRVFKPADITNDNVDAIICGSDQIWNAKITKGLNRLYFCDGIDSRIRRVAYAASAGGGSIDKANEQSFIKLCTNFNLISVREKSLSAYMNRLSIPNTVVSDPVFLLKKEQWKELAVLPTEKDYVLTYSFGEPQGFFNKAMEIARLMKKQLICFSFKKKQLPKEIVQVYNGGPREFLGYFLNASFVMTNSFHGTAFSILLNKPFFSVLPQNGGERVCSLLEEAGLSDRIVRPDTPISSISPIDFNAVTKRLSSFIDNSRSFLQQSIK